MKGFGHIDNISPDVIKILLGRAAVCFHYIKVVWQIFYLQRNFTPSFEVVLMLFVDTHR